MKANRWVSGILMLVLCAGVQLRAQTNIASLVFGRKLAEAEGGDANAQCAIAEIYASGKLIGLTNESGSAVAWTKDEAEAVKWFRKSAEQGCAEAQYGLGVCLLDGTGVGKNQPEAVGWFQKSAAQGFVQAERNLAGCYYEGSGVKADPVEALKWVRKAAEKGDADSEEVLGKAYFFGDGVKRDYSEAFKWIYKAAEQGNATAQAFTGSLFEFGQGVKKDDREAVKWFRKAADQNFALAQYNLGLFYADGYGVAKDEAEAVKLYRKAADAGFAEAQYELARCYGLGIGVNKDKAEAFKWTYKSATQGFSNAEVAVGVTYYSGDGVPKNYIEAYKWMNLASAQGIGLAKQYLSVLEEEMTPEQIGEAQRLSASFVPRKEWSGSITNLVSPFIVNSPVAAGTGFFITDDGYLISNYHVVKDATKVRLLTSAGLIDAKVVQVDTANDLALLKADGRFACLPIAASRTGLLGGTVATVGFPDIGLQGFAPKLAKGEIASLSGAGDDPRYFQVSVPCQPGNSGGALVDERGNVIGIVSAKLDASAALAASGALPENVNYAVKSSFLLSFLESVPGVEAKLKKPNTADEKFEDVVKSAQQAAVLVLVY